MERAVAMMDLLVMLACVGFFLSVHFHPVPSELTENLLPGVDVNLVTKIVYASLAILFSMNVGILINL